MRAPDFWNHRGPIALLLAPLGMLYGLSVALKARLSSPYKASVPVICVGNLTAGGSGKTPVAMAVGEALRQRGKKVFFLTRGYGGSEAGPLLVADQSAEKVGDEALLLAAIAPTVVAADRAAGARFAEANGAEIIVMDDGHQNFSLVKTLSLVVVDGLGNQLMLPAGPLRESVAQGLGRANAVVNFGKEDLAPYQGAVINARLEPEGSDLSGKRVFAFAGIGRPEKFTLSLKDAGAIVTGAQFFGDHHAYTQAEIAGLRQQAKDAALVTTQKDYVRLPADLRAGIAVLKVRVRFDNPGLLAPLLDSLLAAV